MNRQLNPYQSDVEFIKYQVSNYNIITSDNVVLGCKHLKTLPHFKYVGGSFDCYSNQLTSLKGCPTYVGSSLDCNCNQLTSLEYCPTYVGDNFYCRHNNINLSLPEGVIIQGGFHNYAII